MIKPSRRFAAVVPKSLKSRERRFLRQFLRRFAAVSGKPLNSLQRRFRGGCGGNVPHTPYSRSAAPDGAPRAAPPPSRARFAPSPPIWAGSRRSLRRRGAITRSSRLRGAVAPERGKVAHAR